jgi:hypothetical protein
MRHARNRSTPGRSLAVVITLGFLVMSSAACGGTAAAPVTTSAPSAVPARATASPTAASTPAPTGQLVVVTPPPAPDVFVSPLYGYKIDLPGTAEVTQVRPAMESWDGTSRIDGDGPMVDQFGRTGSRLAFILAAPTGLDLDAWAAAVHANAVRDHGCPDEVARERDFEVDGVPAKAAASVCQGVHVYEATLVQDGVGVIAKQLTPPPGTPELEEASFAEFVSFLGRLDLAK